MNSSTVRTGPAVPPPDPTFDPYELWLRARARQRELTPYDLLGLPPLESNATKIRAAILRHASAAASHASRAAPELWAAFEGDLNAAAAALSDKHQKDLLDAALKRRGVTAPQATGAAVRTDDSPDQVDRDAMAAREVAALGIRCASCQHLNGAERKFCSMCGTALWDTCPKCRAARPSSERFCGHCGQDVPEYLAAQSAHLDQQIAMARRLQSEGRFVDARRLVREVARIDDPRAEAHAQLARQLIDEFEADQRVQEARVAAIYQSARQLLEEHAYESAIKALRDVPSALATPEIEQLRGTATERLQETERLLASIRQGLEHKQTLTLFPLLERFLALKPGHAQATRLATQIAEQAAVAANKLAGEGHFQRALEMVRAVPEMAVTDAMRKISDECTERVWLHTEATASSILHPSLPAIVRRLVEIQPQATELAVTLNSISSRQAAGPRVPWQAVPDWIAPPRRSALDLPVDWVGGFQRMDLAANVELPVPRAASSRFYVAAGLALQALGKSLVSINLNQTVKPGMLGRLSFGFRRRGSDAAWGVDLSGSGLKAIKLVWDDARNRATIEACELLELETRVPGESDATADAASAELLRQFAGRQRLEGTRLAVNLPPLQCIAKFVVVPAASSKQLKELIQYEAKQQFPIALDDLVWEAVDSTAVDAEQVQRRILLLAAKKSAVASRLSLFEQAGLNVDVLQCDCLALHNFLQFDLAAAAKETPSAGVEQLVAVVDLGRDGASLMVSGANRIWFRTLTLGGEEFSKVLARELKLTLRQAEQAKREPHRLRRLSKLAVCWDPLMNQLRGEAQRLLEQWRAIDPRTRPSRLLCVGGAAQTYGVIDALRR